MRQAARSLGPILVAVAIVTTLQLWSSGQQQPASKGKNADAARLEFEVVQSFDAKYLGDTPGHLGRAGGLLGKRPQIALGDPIFRGEKKVGLVTGLEWNRVNGSIDIEFDPIDNSRVCIGDEVWMALDASAVSRDFEPSRSK